jgi:hypothetical protein
VRALGCSLKRQQSVSSLRSTKSPFLFSRAPGLTTPNDDDDDDEKRKPEEHDEVRRRRAAVSDASELCLETWSCVPASKPTANQFAASPRQSEFANATTLSTAFHHQRLV